ncbi:hypothetical protein FisN_5Hu508 [Fistulifera solaris]|uniref:MYND-type domain-containing protein n=1 Tax=Fistulifera solaris TaxID=1519565 RepID=A0A1Z5JTD9_FISSO|nr:hypothetical protein FisN_5Hu508 [Fistulifera solaris]|eukprot:GAX17122.1 hypothetical protein FisN_5Hu508 [Fistulifera solaris]
MPSPAFVGALFANFEPIQTGDHVPAYEGKDPRFQDEPWCVNCHNRPEMGLRCCSRCHAAWYCNSKCQKAHYGAHKEICLAVVKTLKHVEQLAIPLRRASFANSENLFETEVGTFGQWEDTRVYMAARSNLVDAYWIAASVVDIKDVWEMALYHVLELQRLDVDGPFDTHLVTPFILLSLHRDDDAFDYIRYHLNMIDADEETIMELMSRHVAFQEGDWIYPREKNCRFLSIFDECPTVNSPLVPLAFLVALLIIKCGIVATYDATFKSIDLAFEATGGQHIQEVKDTVKEMLIDVDHVKIDSQRQQVQQLVDIIHRNNPYMLPAILNPLPLASNERTEGYDRGQPSEVKDIIPYCVRCFLRVPGAEQMLEQRIGELFW